MTSVDELYSESEELKDAGDFEAAISKLNDLLDLDETHVLSHLALAVLLGRVSRHEEAVSHGQQACKLDPNDPFNFTAMSVTYQRAFAGTQNQQYIQSAEDAMAKSQILQSQQ